MRRSADGASLREAVELHAERASRADEAHSLQRATEVRLPARRPTTDVDCWTRAVMFAVPAATVRADVGDSELARERLAVATSVDGDVGRHRGAGGG